MLYSYTKKINLLVITGAILLSLAGPAQAAELMLKNPTEASQYQEKIIIPVYLNSQSENLNALEGALNYPRELMELEQIQDGGSIISFWVEAPREAQEGIRFSGIIPGGYDGSAGLLFKLIFRPRQTGQINFTLNAARILINDGQGTATTLVLTAPPFTISDTPLIDLNTTGQDSVPIDTTRPEDFQPIITALPAVSPGKLFLIFATQDKQSGLAYYEIKEGKKSYIKASSPYLLQYQKRNVEIIIKAVDKAGNTRLVSIPPIQPGTASQTVRQKILEYYGNPLFSGIIWGVLIMVCLILTRILFRKINKGKNVAKK